MTMTEVTPDNLTGMPCCGIKNIQHQGHIEKSGWLKTHFRKGLGSQVMFTEDNRQFGFIEYIPGKYAWRGIEAEDYMVIHCIWTHLKQYQRKGYGKQLLADHQISKTRFRNIMSKIL